MSSQLVESYDLLIPPTEEYLNIPQRGITAPEGFPAAEGMLAAVHRNLRKDPDRVGTMGSVVVFGVAYDGNSCNMHIAEQVDAVAGVINRHNDLNAVRAINPGVSDGITMGHSDMGMSLASREHI